MLFPSFFFFSHLKVLLNKGDKRIFTAKQYKVIAIHLAEMLLVLKILNSSNTY